MARVRAGALALLARIRRTTRPARPAKIRPTKPCSPSPVSARSLAPISLFVRHPSPFLPPLGDDRERPYQPLFLDPNRTGTRRGPQALGLVSMFFDDSDFVELDYDADPTTYNEEASANGFHTTTTYENTATGERYTVHYKTMPDGSRRFSENSHPEGEQFR